MTTITVTQETNWQEIAEALKAKGGNKVIVMSEAELDAHTEMVLAKQWLMAELEKSEDDKRNGRYTVYTQDELKSGKLAKDIIRRAKQQN
ncbi:MAG: hypothetical protein FWB72_06005 [Firmicutes bacterium]|nr:hypothetical protein [Bacillota bacterium]